MPILTITFMPSNFGYVPSNFRLKLGLIRSITKKCSIGWLIKFFSINSSFGFSEKSEIKERLVPIFLNFKKNWRIQFFFLKISESKNLWLLFCQKEASKNLQISLLYNNEFSYFLNKLFDVFENPNRTNFRLSLFPFLITAQHW